MSVFVDNYRAADLTFDSDGIYWVNPENNETYQIMMSWEQPIMEKMADLTVSEGDDVLELGFGMGILSDAIQAKNPKTHTIVELHKDIIPRLKAWAKDKDNVIVIEGTWADVIDQYKTYDSILLDTYADPDVIGLRALVYNYGNDSCKISYWNNDVDLGFDNVTFHDVEVDPPTNKYFNGTTYKVPFVIV